MNGDVRFGPLAALQDDISLMSALGGKADVKPIFDLKCDTAS